MKYKEIVWKVGRVFVILWLLVALPAMQGCEKEKNPDPKTDNKEVFEFIQSLYYYVYYWNKEVESHIVKDPPKSGDPEEYFESLKYDEKKASATDKSAGRYDRWGFMTTFEEYYGVMVEGVYKSLGYNITNQTPDRSVRVCFVYKNSPMDKAGIERGYRLLKLGGVDINVLINNGTVNTELSKETNTYVFADREGKELPAKTISAEEINIDPILCNTIYEVDGKKVGYIAYNSFISASKTAISAALQEMKDVHEFVLDLRYNGGGSTDVAEAICEHLLPASGNNDSVVFAKFVFSDLTKNRLKWNDEIIKIKRQEQAMNLSRMFVITSGNTASASEEVINDMSSFLEVITVGTATHGKPMGMYVFVYPQYSDAEIKAGKLPDWAFAPITFRNANKDGEGDYFKGIPPAFIISDDLYHNFGLNTETWEGEKCLQAVIQFIRTESFPASISAKSEQKVTDDPFQLKGMQIQAGCR